MGFQEPILVKNLNKSNAKWSTHKGVFYWEIDTVHLLIDFPPGLLENM